MINLTLARNNFFVLRLRDQILLILKMWMWGIAKIKKNWIQPPSDPQYGEAEHDHNFIFFFVFYIH